MIKLAFQLILLIVAVVVSNIDALYGDLDYGGYHNFSRRSEGFGYLSPTSYSHSHRIYHPPPRRIKVSATQQQPHIFGDFAGYGGYAGHPVSHSQSSLLDNEITPFFQQLPKYFGYGPQFQPQPQICQQPVIGPCQGSKYRNVDGSCNNLKNPGLGIAGTKYNRLIPARYADGIHRPPRSISGHRLPGARLVSIVMFPDHNIPDPVWTLIAMQWGQVITHDMSMAMGNTQAKPIANQCCSPDGRLLIPKHRAPAQCFPIEIPPDDPLYSKFGQMCMNFMRTTTDADQGCAPIHPDQPQEQIVAVTHYMDASLVYGSNLQTANSLRQGIGGRLLVDVKRGHEWPPSANNKSATCDNQDDDESCYRFGDVRGNQNPQLTVLQIILLREHNRLADTLHHLNPHWDDERIYQEARRILIAEYQHINYYEWLPIFLGTNNMVKHGLIYKREGYINDYREDIDPSVINGHATAAFRYFHSAIQGQLQLISEHRSITGALRLSDFFNRPSVLEEGDNFDKLTRGLSTQNEENIDPFITGEVTNFLFRNRMPFGHDLRAIDIQRGRDHGLASYNDFRQFAGLPRAKKFQDFADFISPENIEKLSLLYEHPDDVDLVVGGSLEAHVPDTLSGPTLLSIMLEQFYRTRAGDRHFYESGNQHTAFTLEQLREIRKASVSRLLCDNGDHIELMQPEGFRLIGSKNQLVSCHNTDVIPAIDLSYWIETPSHGHQQHNFDFNEYFYKK